MSSTKRKLIHISHKIRVVTKFSLLTFIISIFFFFLIYKKRKTKVFPSLSTNNLLLTLLVYTEFENYQKCLILIFRSQKWDFSAIFNHCVTLLSFIFSHLHIFFLKKSFSTIMFMQEEGKVKVFGHFSAAHVHKWNGFPVNIITNLSIVQVRKPSSGFRVPVKGHHWHEN